MYNYRALPISSVKNRSSSVNLSIVPNLIFQIDLKNKLSFSFVDNELNYIYNTHSLKVNSGICILLFPRILD